MSLHCLNTPVKRINTIAQREEILPGWNCRYTLGCRCCKQTTRDYQHSCYCHHNMRGLEMKSFKRNGMLSCIKSTNDQPQLQHGPVVERHTINEQDTTR